jgi:hypothetical protein
MDSSPVQSPIYYGPAPKPFTSFEIALPIYEDLLKQAINVNDDIIPVDLNIIKIISLKRKQPEPRIPFDENHPFSLFNPIFSINSNVLGYCN